MSDYCEAGNHRECLIPAQCECGCHNENMDKVDVAVQVILDVCRKNDGLCMDVPDERVKLAEAIVNALSNAKLI